MIDSAGARDAADARVLLFTPANRPERFGRAVATRADALIFDLEDAVSLPGKDAARTTLMAHFAGPWRQGLHPGQRCGLRANNIHTAAGLQDLEALLRSGVRPDFLVVPKVESAFEVRLYARHLGDLPLLAAIESARGLEAAVEIAQAAPSVRALVFGGADLAADLGSELTWEALTFSRARLVQAAATAGIGVIDMPHFALDDAAELALEAARARAMGFSGKLAIHPKQVGPITAAFTPTAAEVERAAGIIAALARAGGDVVEYQGRMVEGPIVRAAHRVLARAQRD